jgi:hypothetical protein
MENILIKLPGSKGNTVGYKIRGKIDKKLESTWLKELDVIIKKHGKLNVLIWFDSKASWDFEAGMEDMSWGFHNIKNIHKMALVSSKDFWKWFTALGLPIAKLFGMDSKYFEEPDIDDAWKWLKE